MGTKPASTGDVVQGKPKRICTCGGDMLWAKILPGGRFRWSCTICGRCITKDGLEHK